MSYIFVQRGHFPRLGDTDTTAVAPNPWSLVRKSSEIRNQEIHTVALIGLLNQGKSDALQSPGCLRQKVWQSTQALLLNNASALLTAGGPENQTD